MDGEPRRAAYCYNSALAGIGVVTPDELDDVRAVYHLYIVRVPDGRRGALAGVPEGTRHQHRHPLSDRVAVSCGPYAHLGHTEAEFPAALKASSEILSLPMFPELTEEQILYVARKTRSAR